VKYQQLVDEAKKYGQSPIPCAEVVLVWDECKITGKLLMN